MLREDAEQIIKIIRRIVLPGNHLVPLHLTNALVYPLFILQVEPSGISEKAQFRFMSTNIPHNSCVNTDEVEFNYKS